MPPKPKWRRCRACNSDIREFDALRWLLFKVINMLTEIEMLNKIKWDSREDSSLYKVGYIDFNKLKIIEYDDIYIEPGNKFNFIYTGDGELHQIPFHRIKEIFKGDRLVWHRNQSSEVSACRAE
jgi:uncharacterized protein (UPF0248 family)